MSRRSYSSMARFYGVSGPIFGVACLGEASTSTLEVPSHRIIYCGGGGSSKTGVGNAIVAADPVSYTHLTLPTKA